MEISMDQYQYQTLTPLIGPILPQLPFVNDCDLFINNLGGNTGPPGPIGPPGPPGPSDTGIVTVTIISSDYQILPEDYFICVRSTSASIAVTLPAGVLGKTYIIKDCSGNSYTYPIIINTIINQTIDGNNNARINSDYGSTTIIFDGIDWNIA
jgi:hypothetical protein